MSGQHEQSNIEERGGEAFEPAIYKEEVVYSELGLHPLEQRREELTVQAREYIGRTMTQVENPSLPLITKWIDDPNRHSLEAPKLDMLEGQGKKYIEVQYGDDLTLVLDASTTETRMQYAKNYHGFKINHALTK